MVSLRDVLSLGAVAAFFAGVGALIHAMQLLTGGGS
jgi:hypothetical protein